MSVPSISEPLILLVEDDLNQSRGILRMLADLPGHIHLAGSGQEALAKMLRQDFALILMDISMPEMTGIEVAQLMRGNPKTQYIPIIFMTANSQDEKLIEEAYRLGAMDFLYKPLQQEILLAKLSSFLRYYNQEQQAQRLMQKKAEQLTKQNEDLKAFSYVASHDLMSPLNTIKNYADLMLEEYGESLDDLSNRYLSVIARASGRMQTMLEDLLKYSQIGRDRSTHNVNCNHLLQAIRQELQPLIAESQATLTISPLPEVNGVESELDQLFQNLLVNALKFVAPGVSPLVEVSAEKVADAWIFRIRDNGIGIPPEFHDKIFGVFQRLHQKDKYGGSGVGLANCAKIVKLHGGKIWTEANEAGGSSFYVSLPCSTEE